MMTPVARTLATELDTARTAATLYADLVQAGCEIDHHESDLYVKATAAAIRLVRADGRLATMFRSAIDGKQWLDVPFAYAPFWDRASRRAAR